MLTCSQTASNKIRGQKGNSPDPQLRSQIYALFERVAASKPTSWLFLQSHIVFHLAYIWDLAVGLGCFPFTTDFITRSLTASKHLYGILSLIGFSKLIAP